MRYSPMEQQLLELLNAKGGKRISSSDLLKEHYKEEVPFHAQVSIMGALRSLRRKVAQNREVFVIKNSIRRGPWPMEFWIEKRPGT